MLRTARLLSFIALLLLEVPAIRDLLQYAFRESRTFSRRRLNNSKRIERQNFS